MKSQLNFNGGTITTDLVDEQVQAQSALDELINYGNNPNQPQPQMQTIDEEQQRDSELPLMEQQMLQQMEQQVPNY